MFIIFEHKLSPDSRLPVSIIQLNASMRYKMAQKPYQFYAIMLTCTCTHLLGDL